MKTDINKTHVSDYKNKDKLQQRLDELERQIMGGSSDSDSDEEFSFLRGVEGKKAAAKVSTSDTTTDSMFMIDRHAGDAEDTVSAGTSSKFRTKDSVKKDSELSTEHRDKIVEKYSAPSTELQVITEETTLNLGDSTERRKSFKKNAKTAEPEIMKKAVVGSDFEKRHSVPSYSEGKKALARKRMEEKSKVKSGWFNMKAPEMTEELEADLEALQMRSTVASYTGYRKDDYKTRKFFQVATVQDSPLDFYHSRINRKDRKRTLVDELLADAEFRKRNKKAYVKAMDTIGPRKHNRKGGRNKQAAKRTK